MKMPALITLNKAVNASNMAVNPKAQRWKPNGTRPYTVKRIQGMTGLLQAL
jgi:hypothetical protein